MLLNRIFMQECIADEDIVCDLYMSPMPLSLHLSREQNARLLLLLYPHERGKARVNDQVFRQGPEGSRIQLRGI